IARAHVYGVSMGGMIAQELVLRHPRKIRSVVLGCTLCGGEHSKMAEPEIIDGLLDVVRRMGSGDHAAWVDRQLPLLFTPDWLAATPAIRDLFLAMAPILPPTPPETADLTMAGLVDWNSHDRLPQITAPTLIVHGDRDVLIPVENAYVLAGRIPGARLHIVPDAGHGYPAQDPVGVHQVVIDFLRAH